MGLTTADVLADFKASLNDAANVFKGTDADADADFKRHLAVALDAVSREKRTRTVLGTLTLVADQSDYAAPDDLVYPKSPNWPPRNIPVWNAPNDPLPTLGVAEDESGRVLTLIPAPTCRQLACFGSTYRYFYLARHAMTDDALTSTLPAESKSLLILRAQAEAMRELSFRGYAKPVTLRAGSGAGGTQITRNQTPAALFDLLITEFRNAA